MNYTNTVTLPTGRYYIGDPVELMDFQVFEEFQALVTESGDIITFEGREYLVYDISATGFTSTFEYPYSFVDDEGRAYNICSGLICVVKIDDSLEYDEAVYQEVSQEVVFGYPPSCWLADNELTIGHIHIQIPTEASEEYDDYDEGDDEYEDSDW
jgi:hypothetical protein